MKDQLKKHIDDRLKNTGWKTVEKQGMIGWQTNDIGREENADNWDRTPEGHATSSKCAIYCEKCKCFIGRWVVPNSYKAWCKKCA